jgi:cyclic-di-GMP phosphodiesterase, flagellum assembly factor TipF
MDAPPTRLTARWPMPILTHVLLYLAYALVATTVGVGLVGIGEASAAEGFLGGLALFSACAVTHAGVTAAFAAGAIGRAERRIKGDMERLRAAHKDVNEDLDSITARLEVLEEAVEDITTRRDALPAPQASSAPQITAGADLKLIDQIVEKLAKTIDARVDESRRLAPTATPIEASGPITLVRDALDDNRVELHLQPIVTLPQRKTVFYEGFSRLKDQAGRLIMPGEFIPAAERAGLMGSIDNALLFRCVQIVRKLQQKDRRIAIFCNLSPKALSDEHFFPQFFDFLRDHKDLAGSLVFEMGQEAYEGRGGIEARAMSRLADLGYRFSIDKVATVEVDLVDMERSGVKYFKVPGRTLLDQLVKEQRRPTSSITREITAQDVGTVFTRYGIDIIAERIEDEATVRELLDLEIGFAQGHLFGQPRAIKDSLMEETAPPKGFFRDGRGALA